MAEVLFDKLTNKVVNRYLEKIKDFKGDYITLHIVELCHLLGKIEDLRTRLNYIDNVLNELGVSEVNILSCSYDSVNGVELRKMCREVFNIDEIFEVDKLWKERWK